MEVMNKGSITGVCVRKSVGVFVHKCKYVLVGVCTCANVCVGVCL